MKLYIINHIRDGEAYVVKSYRSKETAIKHVTARYSFVNTGDIKLIEKDNKIWFYYKGEPKYVIIECNLKIEANVDGSVLEVGSDGR